jgi:hypothetical protein
MDVDFTFDHARQYISLWAKLRDVNIHEDAMDEITWNLTESGN